MFLMYYENEDGKRVYTLKKTDLGGKMTRSAHPGTVLINLHYLISFAHPFINGPLYAGVCGCGVVCMWCG